MPFKSEAQRRKFGELVKQGKMSQKVFDEWNHETPKKIPERVKEGKVSSRPHSLAELKAMAKTRK